MTTLNAKLADILDRGAEDTEEAELLAAIVDFGVFVPVDDEGAVILVGADGGAVAIAGAVSSECLRERMPEAADAVHCDAVRLLDIARETPFETLTVYSTAGRAEVPLATVAETLRVRGTISQSDQSYTLTWSTHPLAVALRDAIGERLPEFPEIRTVWIAQARWAETGMTGLMLHVVVDEDAPSGVGSQLMETLLAADVTLAEDDPGVGVRVLDPVAEADTIAELDALGLDTVRADPTDGQVTIVSREYGEPEAPTPPRPRRWWRRS
ncbi:hypothetical protein [Embleya sp. NBC_00896]|uniref:hypothetical protein n=1 Tax=Embleya sp. NBC_00896 TaxID=2975961 RepID=UPI002F90CCFC|nr:hypothetical protein OG928_40380 [Embleya sp. NBC_00896]